MKQHIPEIFSQSDPKPMTSQPFKNTKMCFQSSMKGRASSRRVRGFALVVTLSLMILLTIVAVGLLSLSAISLRGSSQGMAQSTAQANARLALMLALGELQKEMGPDQRISAPGGQLLEDGDKSARNHWTGVYDSWPEGSEMRPDTVFRRWLISGNESAVASRQSVEGGASLAAESMDLVPGDADSDPVEAGLGKRIFSR